MKVFIIDHLIGIFALDENNGLLDFKFFSKKSDKIIETVKAVQKGELVKEICGIVENLIKNGYDLFLFENFELAKSVKEEYDVNVVVEKSSHPGRYLRSNIGDIAMEKGFVKDLENFNKALHEAASALARIEITESSKRRDLLVSQAILVIDDLEKNYNLFINRIREWYGYYFPELGVIVENGEHYLKLISGFGLKEKFTFDNLVDEGFSAEKSELMVSSARSSIGAQMREGDVHEIQCLARTLEVLNTSKKNLEPYLDQLMKEVAPNIQALVGSSIGARLINAAGGLESLAKKSSSTIQVLGAEKALFRSLRTGTKPPKHGLIFQCKEVHTAPKRQRGKISRALAGKLVIAARIDFYKGEYMGDRLKMDFEKRVEEIRRKYE